MIPIYVDKDYADIKIPSRSLKPEEITLAKNIFGNTIKYDKVRVFDTAYMPGQPKDVIMTPDGHLHPGKEVYRDNYALDTDSMKHLFIHEMAHVWQNHRGMWVRLTGAAIHICYPMKNLNPYYYDIHKSESRTVKRRDGRGNLTTSVVVSRPKLLDYNLESQAEIIADYWALKFKSNPALMRTRNFETNVRSRNINEVIRLYEAKVKQAIGF